MDSKLAGCFLNIINLKYILEQKVTERIPLLADGAAASEDEPLAGGLADGGGVARLLRQVRVRRRARTVLPLHARRTY